VDRFEGFREFMTVQGDRLSRFAYLLTGDHHAAEDLLQTALARVAARWPKVSRYERPEAYVRRAMVNEHISGWRRRRKLVEQPVEAVPDRYEDDRSEDAVRRLMLKRALAALPPRQRAVIVLRYFSDLTESEVADEMGCAVGTVKSQAHAALATLRANAPHLAELLTETAEVTT
jgi:RNA polymerase sigma-70 factor (sigma-E family)